MAYILYMHSYSNAYMNRLGLASWPNNVHGTRSSQQGGAPGTLAVFSTARARRHAALDIRVQPHMGGHHVIGHISVCIS